jgi:tricorn protease
VDLSGGDLRRHTDFRDFYVRNASTDGRRIVFQVGGDIYLYDPATGRVRLVDIDLPLSRKAKMAKFVDPVKHLEHFFPASGTNLVVVSRGQAFSVPAWEGAVVQLGVRGGVRYKHISTDGRRSPWLHTTGPWRYTR